MKKLLRSLLLSSLLFNAANSQTDFLWQKEFKVNYEGKSYLSKEYKEKGEKRKFAYYIYELDENGEAINLIGDMEDEFGRYWSTALTSNYFSDRWNMRQDISKIEILFSKTNEYYQLNKATHGLTEELTRFGTKIVFTKDLTKEDLAETVNEDYLARLKDFGKQIGNEIVNNYLDGKIKNEKGLKRILKEKFFDESVTKTQDIISGLESCKNFLKDLGTLNSEEVLRFRGRLYNLLNKGYENYAMQRAWILFVNDPLNKANFIGREVLETSLNQIERGDQIHRELTNLGLDFESLDKKLSYYVEKELKRVLELLHKEIFLEENEFNLRDKNSLASKLLQQRTKKEDEDSWINLKRGSWSILWYPKTLSSPIRFDKNDLVFDLDTKNNSIAQIGTANLIEYNFKELNKNAELRFELEYILSRGVFEYVKDGIFGYVGMSAFNGNEYNHSEYKSYDIMGCACPGKAERIKSKDPTGFTETWKIKILPRQRKYIVERTNKNNTGKFSINEYKIPEKEWVETKSFQFIMGLEILFSGVDYQFLAKFRNFKIKFE